MKNSLVFVSLLCLMIPAVALGGNAEPRLYLETFATDQLPSHPPPSYVCSHDDSPGPIHCYAPKSPGGFLYLALHVDHLDETCPPGASCDLYGGYRAVGLGIEVTGEPVLFVSLFACPGFMPGPSVAGWPAAICVASFDGCRGRLDHPFYLTFANDSECNGATYFDIVESADPQSCTDCLLINCSNEWDENTVVACRAQWGGTQQVTCAEIVPVTPTTWGKIKGLFR
ncbi:MAG: hypothetical protein JSW03_00895 [Candidatus Eiseniibacteriota bacterium]|nr:MAG: hypothetical protein JSW03_00895 [Candidatus Eisenbacteria bacterium]